MHFNAVQPNGKLFGVTRYHFSDSGRLERSSFSQTVIYQDGGYWLEEQGVETIIGEEEVVTHEFASRRWDTDMSPTLLNVLVLDPSALSIQNLYAYATYLEEQQLENSEYWLSFWRKLLQPLITAGLVIIAVSFIFGPLREVTMGYRIFTGVIVGIVFRTAQDLLGPASLVYGFSPLFAVSLPMIVCFGVGFYLLRKSN